MFLKQSSDFFFENAWNIRDVVYQATLETLYMVLLTCVFAGILGLLLGIGLTVTQEGGLYASPHLYRFLNGVVNLFRSLPFIILMALLIPLTRLIVGTIIGPTAASVPLIVATIPFFARQIQIALLEVGHGKIEAAQAMGLSKPDIIRSVYLVEGLPSIIRVSASTVINVIGLSTMAGVVGGGGLGTVAIAKGYQRSRFDVILVATFFIVVIVLLSEAIFKSWMHRLDQQTSKKVKK